MTEEEFIEKLALCDPTGQIVAQWGMSCEEAWNPLLWGIMYSMEHLESSLVEDEGIFMECIARLGEVEWVSSTMINRIMQNFLWPQRARIEGEIALRLENDIRQLLLKAPSFGERAARRIKQSDTASLEKLLEDVAADSEP